MTEEECDAYLRYLSREFFSDDEKPEWMHCFTQWAALRMANMRNELIEAKAAERRNR